LLFIDPVNTGYSRAVVGEKPEQFFGYNEDIQAVGEFIRLTTTKYGRWASPKFLTGESYGTTRATGLSGYLQDRYNLYTTMCKTNTSIRLKLCVKPCLKTLT
jgi:carboxypeptidase C (cathepsin A)